MLSTEIIKSWPEVFGEVKLNILPLRYLHSVIITFTDGKIWAIRLTADVRKAGWEALEKILLDLIKEYEDYIKDVDFKLDANRVKKDIEKKTKKFLKNKNIQ